MLGVQDWLRRQRTERAKWGVLLFSLAVSAALLAIAKGNWEQAEEHYRVARDTAQRGGNPSALMLAREVEQKLEAHQKHLLSEDGAAS